MRAQLKREATDDAISQKQLDEECIRLFLLNAPPNRIPAKTIAEATHVSERTIWRRIARGRELCPPARLLEQNRIEYVMFGPDASYCEHGVPRVRLSSGEIVPYLCLWCDQTNVPDHPVWRKVKYSEPVKPPPTFQPKKPRGKKAASVLIVGTVGLLNGRKPKR